MKNNAANDTNVSNNHIHLPLNSLNNHTSNNSSNSNNNIAVASNNNNTNNLSEIQDLGRNNPLLLPRSTNPLLSPSSVRGNPATSLPNEHLYSSLYGREIELMRKIFKSENRDRLIDNPLLQNAANSVSPDELLLKTAGFPMNYPSQQFAAALSNQHLQQQQRQSTGSPKPRYHDQMLIAAENSLIIKQEPKSMLYQSPNSGEWQRNPYASPPSSTTTSPRSIGARKFDTDELTAKTNHSLLKQLYDDSKLQVNMNFGANKQPEPGLHKSHPGNIYPGNIYPGNLNASAANFENLIHLQQQQLQNASIDTYTKMNNGNGGPEQLSKSEPHPPAASPYASSNSNNLLHGNDSHHHHHPQFANPNFNIHHQQQSPHQLHQQNHFLINNKLSNGGNPNTVDNNPNASTLNNVSNHSDSNNNSNSIGSVNSKIKNARLNDYGAGNSISTTSNSKNATMNGPNVNNNNNEANEFNLNKSIKSDALMSDLSAMVTSKNNISNNNLSPSTNPSGGGNTNSNSASTNTNLLMLTKCANETTNEFLLHNSMNDGQHHHHRRTTTNTANQISFDGDDDKSRTSSKSIDEDDHNNVNSDEEDDQDEFMNL